MLLLNIISAALLGQSLHRFNTSYVVIKQQQGYALSDYEKVSIHLMLLLNGNNPQVDMSIEESFNTSYVVIKRYYLSIKEWL